jgi:hypothetical protein
MEELTLLPWVLGRIRECISQLELLLVREARRWMGRLSADTERGVEGFEVIEEIELEKRKEQWSLQDKGVVDE